MEIVTSMTLLESTKVIPQTITNKVNCMVFVDDGLLINKFKIKVGFVTINDNPILNEIALDQIDLFFKLLMDNCIIMSKDLYDKTINPFNNNIFMVHEKPNDQVIASMIFLKLVNIVGENLGIEYVSLTSNLGNKICYTIDMNSAEIEVLLPTNYDWWKDKNIKFDPWWLRADTASYDLLINRDEIYKGEFLWEDYFKDDLKEADDFNKPKGKFKLIPGGKNE